MANENNLIPIEHLSKEEAKKRGSAGGKASVASRRRKRDMKACMEMLLSLPADNCADYNFLVEMGLDVNNLSPDEVNNMLVVNAVLLQNAKKGDVASIKELRSIIQDDAYIKHKIKLERERFRFEKSQKAPETAESSRYNGIPAALIAPNFASLIFDIKSREHLEYVLQGGRGSTKSSFISLNILDVIMENPELHACVLRQNDNTLRTSVYAQICWAIDMLGLSGEFKATVSPVEITRISTGQKIYFRGANNPDTIKSIKVPFGYIGVLWFEELDQFGGPESVRKIEQSVIRGGENAYIFKSFNPPKSASNWANQYIITPKDSRIVHTSTYETVPRAWLGKPFVDEADFLKGINPAAYENEYLGVANGNGGNVFDNVIVRTIADDEIRTFGNIYHGVDWGWYPDPYAYNRMAHLPSQGRLFIYDEFRANKLSNRQTADILFARGVTPGDVVMCDSAENKSVGDYREYGLLARGVEKGPGSVDYSMKWLQSLREIIIDPERCPDTAKEFLKYEYERDKEGNVISGYPDKNNHHIDAVRYAMHPVWRRKGQ